MKNIDISKPDHYVYYHFRPDTGGLFYVGIGNRSRYKSKHGRNILWNNIVKKNQGVFLAVKAIEGISYEKACDTERLIISIYGRTIMGNGILCNFSEGGEKNKGGKATLEHRLKISISNKGKNKRFGSENNRFGTKHSNETRGLMSVLAGSKILNAETGIYYESISDAAFSVNMKYGRLRAMLNGQNRNKTQFTTVSKIKYNG